MDALATGAIFAGHRIVAVLGRGGMGVVYRAVDETLDRPVAMKLIAPELAVDATFRERFTRESRAAASIRHPNVVPIFHAGESDGLLYVTMELVEGIDMRALIARQGRLEPYLAAELVAQAAAALDAAHARGLVHRDVKPANVLVEEREGGHHVYLTDFGLTKSIGSQSGPTQSGALVGTLDYMAPEQLRGQSVDARTDVYSLGCVLFNALTGHVPYPRDVDAAKLWAHVGEDPPSVCAEVPDLPSGFDEVVRRAMAKAREDRYPSAGDLGRAALAAAAQRRLPDDEHTVARGPAAPGGRETAALRATGTLVKDAPDRRTPRKALRRGVVLTAAITALVAVAGVAVVLTRGKEGGASDSAGSQPANPAGAVVGQPLQVTGGRDLAWDIAAADGRVWVTFDDARDRETLARIDARTRRVTRAFAAYPRADREQENFDMGVEGRYVWIATARDHVTRIDTANGARTDIPIPDLREYWVAVADRVAWILSDTGRLFGIDATSSRVTRRPARFARDVTGLTAGDGYVFVAQRDGRIREFDAASGEVATFPLRVPKRNAERLRGLTYEGGTLYVVGSDFRLHRADVTTGAPGPSVRLPRYLRYLALQGTDAWYIEPVVRRLIRLDLRSGKPVGRPIALPRTPQQVAIDGRRVWVLSTDGSVTEVRH